MGTINIIRPSLFLCKYREEIFRKNLYNKRVKSVCGALQVPFSQRYHVILPDIGYDAVNGAISDSSFLFSAD